MAQEEEVRMLKLWLQPRQQSPSSVRISSISPEIRRTALRHRHFHELNGYNTTDETAHERPRTALVARRCRQLHDLT